MNCSELYEAIRKVRNNYRGKLNSNHILIDDADDMFIAGAIFKVLSGFFGG